MNAQHAAELRAQITRQTAELVDYQHSIDAATASLAAANAAVQPAIDRTAKLEAELKAAKDEVEAGQPAISAATSVLDGLNANAAALRQSIATCEELLKQPITEDPQQPVIAPMRVPTAALLIIMRKRGLREQFDTVCASLPPEQQEYVKEMLQMPYTRRDHPLVAMVQQAFGWTDAEVDALFAEADAV
jgi:phage-related tail protein